MIFFFIRKSVCARARDFPEESSTLARACRSHARGQHLISERKEHSYQKWSPFSPHSFFAYRVFLGFLFFIAFDSHLVCAISSSKRNLQEGYAWTGAMGEFEFTFADAIVAWSLGLTTAYIDWAAASRFAYIQCYYIQQTHKVFTVCGSERPLHTQYANRMKRFQFNSILRTKPKVS